jgi:hypothetical protein
MAEPQILYGPTFGNELNDAGIGNLPIAWTPYELTGRENLNPQQNTQLDAVIAAHDPTKQLLSQTATGDFIARWTNAEYLALQKRRTTDNGRTAKNWDNVTSDPAIDMNKKKVQSLKTDLVADGILTQARADVIFS